jgi:3D-(3,5/4)-trihydroxycyclohexane-1,2-dione acylhydrolase (decyclizing)
VNQAADPEDVVVCAAGSLPGDLHKLWRARTPNSYHLEYGYSCMGYEVAGGLGVKMAQPDRQVYVMVGDGSFLLMSSEIVTAIQEGYKLNVVLLDNHGFSSIGGLSQSVGSYGFGTDYRYRTESGQLDGEYLPVDFVKLAQGYGAKTVRTRTHDEAQRAITDMRKQAGTTVVVIEVDKEMRVPGYESWWDVPMSEVSGLESIRNARAAYEEAVKLERHHEVTAQAVTV